MLVVTLDLWHFADSRGERLSMSKLFRDPDDDRVGFVALSGCDYVCDQVEQFAIRHSGERIDPTSHLVREQGVVWRRAMRYDRRQRASMKSLLRVLGDSLTLHPVDELDAAMALDFYKQPEVGTGELENTEIGELVQRMKYWKSNPSERRRAGSLLSDKLADLVADHPEFRRATAIVAVPSTNSRVSEKLGASVAYRLELPTVKARETTGSTVTVKNGGGASKRYECAPEAAGESVLVIDDVYQSGGSMRSIARAARMVGAAEVRGLVCARNLRSN